MKRTIKIIFFTLIILTLIVCGVLVYFFYSTDAPITNGEMSYNVEYKKELSLDIYWPTKKVYEKEPVVIFFHGGAWITGRKETVNNNRFNGAINILRDNGYVVISPEYTLANSSKSPFPDCIIDAFDLSDWILTHADEYNFDLNNIGVFGESAGAHIAMMLALSTDSLYVSNYNDRIKINYVVDVYGPADLKLLYQNPLVGDINHHIENLPKSLKNSLDISKQLFGFDPLEDSLRAQQIMWTYSPTTYINENSPPFLLIHGNEDQVVPINQSIYMKHLLDSLGVQNDLHILNGVNHGFIGADEFQKEKTQNWITDFILKNYIRENSHN